MKKLEIIDMQKFDGGADWFGFFTGVGCVYTAAGALATGLLGNAVASGLLSFGSSMLCAY